jgi:hypothetical protein
MAIKDGGEDRGGTSSDTDRWVDNRERVTLPTTSLGKVILLW